MRATLRSGWFGLGLAWTMVAWSGEARADAVGPGPADCPDGATPNACHGAEYCSPVTCSSDANCTGGKICKPVSMCIRSETCFGGAEGGSDTPVQDLVEVCSEGVTCKGGACETLILCIDPEEPTSGGSAGSSTAASSDETGGTGTKKDGCGCHAHGEAAPGLLLAALLGLVVRRRHR